MGKPPVIGSSSSFAQVCEDHPVVSPHNKLNSLKLGDSGAIPV